MKLQISDSQMKKGITWHILRLLRLGSGTKEDLTDKLADIYLGYWPANKALVAKSLSQLEGEGLIRSGDGYEITERGLEAVGNKEKELERYFSRHLSKEACARSSLWANVGLSALEFGVGFLSGSIGLIADAIHTAVDILASAITWIGIRINKEAQAGAIGGIVLCGIGGFIIYKSITNIFEGAAITFQIVALATIIVNIAVNGFFAFYKFYVGGRTRSIALVADAYHTQTDIWSSVAVLVGLVGVTVGFHMLDAIAGAIVSLFIMYGGYELILESVKVMHGEDLRLEKFSYFLKKHLELLPDRGTLASLWLLNLQAMTKEEHLERLKRGWGRRYPIALEEKDYEPIYEKLENDGLVESAEGRLVLTQQGRKELENVTAYGPPWWGMRRHRLARIIGYFAEGL